MVVNTRIWVSQLAPMLLQKFLPAAAIHLGFRFLTGHARYHELTTAAGVGRAEELMWQSKAKWIRSGPFSCQNQ